MEVREQPCIDCPFDHEMTDKEISEATDGCPESMLCHQSWCLDGIEPDVRCRGFRDNFERLRQQ